MIIMLLEETQNHIAFERYIFIKLLGETLDHNALNAAQYERS